MLEAAAALLKGLGYAATLTAAGPVLAGATLRNVPKVSALTQWAGITLAVVTCGAAWLFLLRLDGQADAVSIEAIFLSPLGLALALQLAGGLWIATIAQRGPALPGAVMTLAAFGIVGHAASNGVLTACLILVHVACVVWWFGGLCVLLLGSHRSPPPELGRQVAKFSRQAILAVALLAAAAFALSALLVDFRFDPSRAYQRGLLAKLGLFLTLLALAAINKLRLTPKLATEANARAWLRRTIAVEMVLFAALLATTAWLTTYQSPHDEGMPAHGHPARPEATAPIAIIDAWAPAMFGGARTGAVYLVVANNQRTDDKLMSASSPWAEKVTLHVSVKDGLIVRMREMQNMPIAAGSSATLAPGDRHLMFTGLYAPFVAGDAIPLMLTFEKAGDIQTMVKVLPPGDRPGAAHDHGAM
jgi:copper(I)-binding protein